MGMELKSFYPLYLRLLGGVMGSSHKKLERTAMGLAAPLLQKFGDRLQLPKLFENYLEGASQSHVDWLRDNERRNRLLEKFLQTFEQYDVILCPNNMTTSFRHHQQQDVFMRKVLVDGKMRNYTDMFMWIAPATVLGTPATSAPVGVTKEGLPVNVQIMGGAYQDKTTIRFAKFLEKAGFTFQPPAGY